MRIHTNTIGYTQTIRNALAAEKAAERIASHVTFKTLSPHRSTSHLFAFEIQLEAEIQDNGRRVGNSGSYGALNGNGYAATFDEWGWLLAALYELDPDMVVGSVKNPIYANREDFDQETGLSYNPTALLEALWPTFPDSDPFPYVVGRAAQTKRGYQVGRRGYGRVTAGYAEAHPYWPAKYAPRTERDVREFAHLGAFAPASNEA